MVKNTTLPFVLCFLSFVDYAFTFGTFCNLKSKVTQLTNQYSIPNARYPSIYSSTFIPVPSPSYGSSLQMSSNINDDESEDNPFLGGLSYFVPGFITIWALGYLTIGYIETQGGGLGDSGG